jgi:flavin reductase (DIM6/NTAB) family NADH-FMN oxidoreductase RutF
MSGFPSGVSVVTTVDREHQPRGVTCSSLSSVTLAPPTLLVCLRATSSTLQAMRETGTFAVNLLHARGRQAAVTFSSPLADRFAEVRWRSLEDSHLPHLFRDAFAVASCRVAETFRVGDHDIVLGQVFDIRISPDAPLLYGMRRYSAWRPDGERSSPPPRPSPPDQAGGNG